MVTSTGTFRFGDFELDLGAYELRRGGRPVSLERHPMDLLILLVERRSQLVSRADIVERLWGKDVFVDVETGVNTAMRKVRQALRDSPEAPAFVETVPGRGYRFIAAVERGPKSPSCYPARACDCTASHHGCPSARGEVGRLPAPAWAILVALRRGRARRRLRAVEPIGAVASVRVSARRAAVRELGSDPEREYLADGLTEETSASLAQIDPST